MLNYFSAINPTHDYKQKPATLVLEAIDSISIKAFACSTVLVKPWALDAVEIDHQKPPAK